MTTTTPKILALAVLLLVACDSSTDPSGGSGRFDLARAFDDDVVEIEEETDGTRLRFDGIDFGGTASNALTDADKTVLDGFAAVFAGLEGVTYRVESHTDQRGAADFNQNRSRIRAEAVRDYLIDVVGGPGPYVTSAGLGESVLLDEASTQVAWARNDRVEVVISRPEGPAQRVVLTAETLDVLFDCDRNPSPDELQPGDFFVSVSIRISNRDGFYVMDEVVDSLVTANDGDFLDLGIAASTVILPVEGDILEIYIGFAEFDGSGNFDFRTTRVHQFFYVPELECWGPDRGSLLCGVIDTGAIFIEDGTTGGPPCETTLTWSLRLEDVP